MNKVPAAPTLGHTLSYMYAYSLYLFFDFAGYSAFAIGFSYLLGVHTPENFNRPFLSRNIKEFWTRWHITLSFWFRDFIYMRFLLTAFKKKWFRRQDTRRLRRQFPDVRRDGFLARHGDALSRLRAVPRLPHHGARHLRALEPAAARMQPARVWGDSLPWQIAGHPADLPQPCASGS